MIAIVNYGMGNLQSVYKAFRRVTKAVTVSERLEEIEKCSKLVLPGVGHFKKGMENLREIIPLLDYLVLERQIPVLGICLGMQLMAKYSEEGQSNGIGWVDTSVKKFELTSDYLKVPHMGWNTIKAQSKENILLNGIGDNNEFYFVHSYYVSEQNSYTLCTTNYGIDFVSGFEKGNIFATQFHPEKSHKQGLKLIRNFVTKT